MLIFNHIEIGDRLRELRKKSGYTQIELAEAANIADRTYADIERGCVNMRLETLLKICDTLGIQPNDLLVKIEPEKGLYSKTYIERFQNCTDHEKNTVISLLDVYLTSVGK